jgi:hypothetical protein
MADIFLHEVTPGWLMGKFRNTRINNLIFVTKCLAPWCFTKYEYDYRLRIMENDLVVIGNPCLGMFRQFICAIDLFLML